METDKTANPDSLINLTDSAVRQIRSMSEADPSHAAKHLRIYVEGGGCSGLQYGMVFDDKQKNDLSVSFDGVTVVVDAASANLVRGSEVDFVDSLNGSGFKISNPNARHNCGCGKSFEA